TGLILGATGTALLTRVNADSRYVLLLPTLVLLGTGLGLLTTPLVATAIASVPHDQAGLAIGVNNTARQSGAAIGIALFGTLTGSTTDPHRFMVGLHLAGITAATLYLLTAAATATFLPPRASTVSSDRDPRRDPHQRVSDQRQIRLIKKTPDERDHH
ncbi:hypothetical protein ACFXPJ_38940, partial [Streptomyces goshikiensis]